MAAARQNVADELSMAGRARGHLARVEHLRKADDGVERGPELVRDVRQELALETGHLLDLSVLVLQLRGPGGELLGEPRLGDVADRCEVGGVALPMDRYDAHLADPLLPAAGHGNLRRLPVLHREQQLLPQQVLAGHPEQGEGGLIHVPDEPGRAHYDDGVGRGLEQLLEVGAHGPGPGPFDHVEDAAREQPAVGLVLGEDLFGPRGAQRGPVFSHRTGNDHDWHVSRRLGRPPDRLHALGVRQRQVEDHDVERLPLHSVDGPAEGRLVNGRELRVGIRAQPFEGEECVPRVVFDQQDPRRHLTAPRRTGRSRASAPRRCDLLRETRTGCRRRSGTACQRACPRRRS